MWTAVLAVWELHQGNGKQGFHYGPRNLIFDIKRRGPRVGESHQLLHAPFNPTTATPAPPPHPPPPTPPPPTHRHPIRASPSETLLNSERKEEGIVFTTGRRQDGAEEERGDWRRPPPSVGGGSVEERGDVGGAGEARAQRRSVASK
ncbi:unnamed protein product [Arctogadus glacialis]